MDDEPIGAHEPAPERPVLRAGEGGGARVSEWIVNGEHGRISRGQREQTGVVVLVNVHDLRTPAAELSSYRQHRRDRRERANTARNLEHLDPLAPETRDQVVPLRRRAPELEGVRTAEHRDLVTNLRQRSRLLCSVLEQEIADDQDAHEPSLALPLVCSKRADVPEGNTGSPAADGSVAPASAR